MVTLLKFLRSKPEKRISCTARRGLYVYGCCRLYDAQAFKSLLSASGKHHRYKLASRQEWP